MELSLSSDELEGEWPRCGAGHLDAVLDALDLLLPLRARVAEGALEPLPALGLLVPAPARHGLRLSQERRRARRRKAPHESRRRHPQRHAAAELDANRRVEPPPPPLDRPLEPSAEKRGAN